MPEISQVGLDWELSHNEKKQKLDPSVMEVY